MQHQHVSERAVKRLSRIEGHVRGIREMVATGRDCGEVLIQIAAVRAAVDQVGRLILEDHLGECITAAMAEGKGQEAIDDLKIALKRFIG